MLIGELFRSLVSNNRQHIVYTDVGWVGLSIGIIGLKHHITFFNREKSRETGQPVDER